MCSPRKVPWVSVMRFSGKVGTKQFDGPKWWVEIAREATEVRCRIGIDLVCNIELVT